MKTRVACVERAGAVTLREIELNPAPNEILVKSYMASICGTDKNYYMGKAPSQHPVADPTNTSSKPRAYPILMGHEGAGVVVEAGPGISDFAPGDKVISFGWKNTMSDYWVGAHKPYGLSLVRVPDGMSMETAALCEPSVCSIYAGMNSGVQLGDTVCVVGAGFAGQVMAQVVKAMGAGKVIVVDVVDGKLNLAKSLGADIVLNAKKQDVIEEVMRETKNLGADVVLEAGGNSQTLQTATEVLKHGGILGIYSWTMDPVSLLIDRWHNNGFDIRTLAILHQIRVDKLWWVQKTMDVIVKGIVKIDPLISNVYALSDVKAAFETACYDENACKVMLKP